MVCMNTKEKNSENNRKLRQLIEAAELSHVQALALINRGLGFRAIKESTWKGYFCSPETTRFRGVHPDLLAHAERVLKSRVK